MQITSQRTQLGFNVNYEKDFVDQLILEATKNKLPIQIKHYKDKISIVSPQNHLVEYYRFSTSEVVSGSLELGIWISQNHLELAAYQGGLTISQLTLLSMLIGSLKCKVLKQGGIMNPEDIIHDSGCNCILAQRRDFLLESADLFICQGSIAFYEQLSAITEINILLIYLSKLNES